ncbi:MAG: prolyl oligopeptidase family serine peptidase [Trueperaceae bacterium]
MARLPMWVFHGDADTVVPVEDSLALVEKVRALGGNPRLTIYAGVGHDSWDRAYGDPELRAWLVAQRRRV